MDTNKTSNIYSYEHIYTRGSKNMGPHRVRLGSWDPRLTTATELWESVCSAQCRQEFKKQ